jgi:Neuraminidase (sialidase)
MVNLADGRVLFAWSRFGGGGHDDAEAVIAARYSPDGGITWSERDEVLITREGAKNVMCVSLLRLRDGRVAMCYLRKEGFHDCRLRMRTSADEGLTWSEPVLCIPAPGYHVVNNDRVVQLKSGRILVPASYHRRRIDDTTDWAAYDPRGIFICYLSDDAGRTWRESRNWQAAPRGLVYDASGKNEGLEEPGVVELSDGRVFAWARTSLGRQYGMESSDGGETWSEPQPTGFISPNSPMSMKRVPSTGHLLAIWNDHSGRLRPKPISDANCTDRWPLVIATSPDEGRTWANHSVLDDEAGMVFSYPAIHFPDAQHALIAYWVQDNRQVHGGFTNQRVRRLRIA